MRRRPLYGAALRDRRRALIWWVIALLLTTVMIASSYGAIEGQTSLDESFDEMPESLKVLLGIDEELTLTSPAGYLNSQWFANFFPILLSIYGIGLAARLLAGEEGDGRLEVLLAYPVARRRVLRDRGLAVVTLLTVVFVLPSVALVALAPAFDLDGIGLRALSAASVSSFALALLHSAVTYAVGAWTGRRGVAIAVGAAVTGGGFLLQSLASISETLRPVRWLSPWYWFVDARPIVDGWGAMVVPMVITLALCAAVIALGTWRFDTRDIGAR
jgi:ABC-2 type transport system permease protein